MSTATPHTLRGSTLILDILDILDILIQKLFLTFLTSSRYTKFKSRLGGTDAWFPQTIFKPHAMT